jgi:hypothetical protein
LNDLVSPKRFASNFQLHFDLTTDGPMLKILAINMDNAKSNDKQTCKLASLENSFEVFNRVRCFNHTLQLAAKALLHPLNPSILGGSGSQAIISKHASEMSDNDDSPLVIIDDESDDENENSGGDDSGGMDDPDDNIDELLQLDSVSQRETLHHMVIVREVVSKVSSLLW